MTDGAVVWFTGLPASGKTTAAMRLVGHLRAQGREPVLLDSDEIRGAIVPPLGYDAAARDAFYQTLGNLACMLAWPGAIVAVSATAHLRRWRDAARGRAPRFVEVYVATPADECRRRDPKHLYRDPQIGADLPGVHSTYEPPLHPEVVAPNGDDEATIAAVLAALRCD